MYGIKDAVVIEMEARLWLLNELERKYNIMCFKTNTIQVEQDFM